MVTKKIPVKLIHLDTEITLYLTESFIRDMKIRYACQNTTETNSFEFSSLKDYYQCVDRAEKA